MTNIVAATFGAIAKDVILARALAAGEAEQLEPEQVALIQKVCAGTAQPPAPLLGWLEGLMPGITDTIGQEINQTAQEMLEAGDPPEAV